MEGLFLSDSLYKDIPVEAQQELIKHFNLRKIEFAAFGGYTTEQLIGRDGLCHELMKKRNFSHLFLSCGANDFNKSPHSTGERKGRGVVNILKDCLHQFCLTYPCTKVILFPIPFRQVSSHKNQRFPNNSDPDWIYRTNVGIDYFRQAFKVCQCHQSQCDVAETPEIDFWIEHLQPDGLHLKQSGKTVVIRHVAYCSNAPRFSVSPAAEFDFPPLPKCTSSFSPLECQVKLPPMKRFLRSKLTKAHPEPSKPMVLPPLSSPAPSRLAPSRPAPSRLVPSPPAPSNLPPPQKRKRKKAKNPSAYLYTSTIDPATVFSQKERTQKRLRRVRDFQMPSVSPGVRNRRRRRRLRERKEFENGGNGYLPADDLPADDLSANNLPENDLPADDLPKVEIPKEDFFVKATSYDSCTVENKNTTFCVQGYGLYGFSKHSSTAD